MTTPGGSERTAWTPLAGRLPPALGVGRIGLIVAVLPVVNRLPESANAPAALDVCRFTARGLSHRLA
ncbi:MAG TPA: hypothetical protein VFW69_09820 [Mycobacterium sp.]|nr:hypothetical protein [Mycobacterium sp.]